MSDFAPTPVARCPRCGGTTRQDAPAGLCAACQQMVASEPTVDLVLDAGPVRPPTRAGGSTPGEGARLVPGQEFGAYRIVRLLGRGGMGEVYEAEQRDQGRRVALKVLNQRLTDPDDRARFLREGQLAASISHPNSVYIFGSEDIAGTPVIAMELLAGGTLKDCVHEHGPLPAAAAVDAILQVIAGLDAAHAAGILHRDVKPANCFVDRDGAVKVGDFGLSIPIQAPDVTALTTIGHFQGTPQFAPPERLKGVPQDVRADIYAVGATLYYLLTGRAPFDDTDLLALVTRIATEVPRSPREVVRTVPRGLAAVVVRCLAKDPGARPATYAALNEALRPFGSAAPTPATIGLRFVAGAIDRAILWISVPLNMTIAFRSAAGPPWWLGPIEVAMVIAYYGIQEGLWGASLGKRMVGLRVTKADGQPPGMARALWRAAVFYTPSVIQALPALLLGQTRMMELDAVSPMWGHAVGFIDLVLLGLLFSTARQRNGFAGVHELASGTRVGRRLEHGARSVLAATSDAAPVGETSPHRYGPYDVVGTLGLTDAGELLVGFDPRLRRHVWIHALPPGTPGVAPLIRDLSRPGRLRWLSGGRSNNDAWDAYEALDGVALVSLLGTPRPWYLVRPWLTDLAREIDAGLTDGSITALTIAHVWTTHDGYAKLLDFRAPGVPSAAQQEEPATLESGQTFLARVAQSALDRLSGDGPGGTAAGVREPLPLSAAATLKALARRGFGTWPEVVARTTALLQGPDRVGRWQRAVPLALCGVVPVGMGLLMSLIASVTSTSQISDVVALNDALMRLSSLSQNVTGERARERAALEVYIAAQFRPMITDPHTWTTAFAVGILGPRRPLAERVVAEHLNVSADELAMARATLGPFLREQERSQERRQVTLDSGRLALFLVGFLGALTFISLLGIVWAFILRGGLLLRACGIVVVTDDGKPASRLRALWRGLVAWTLVPVVLVLAFSSGLAFFSGTTGDLALGLSVVLPPVVLFLAGVICAVVDPARGLQDLLAGTWLVPQ